MIIQGKFPFLKEKKHVIALVGAGGKTTLMYALARQFTESGARTLVSTTTHIFEPEKRLQAANPGEAEKLWQRGSYAVVGQPAENGKWKSLPQQELDAYIHLADIVLLEADGSKRLPCKVPAQHEPVIPDACDIVIGVMGMETYGKPLREVCFRQKEAVRLLHASSDDIMTADRMAKILASEQGTRKNVGERDYYVVLNQCDSRERIQAGEDIMELLKAQGVAHCILTSFAGKQGM